MTCNKDDCSGKIVNIRPIKIKREEVGYWGISTLLHCTQCDNFTGFFAVGIKAKGKEIRCVVEEFTHNNELVCLIE